MTPRIATPHAEASRAGEAAFRAGGNAIDAALTAAAVLSVAYPHMCSIGGDLVGLVVTADGTASAVMGCGPAGLRADASALRARSDAMPWAGPATVTVPGAVDGWGAVARLGAALPWADLLAPAVRLARDGVPVARRVRQALDADPVLPTADGVLVQPALAASLEQIAAGGPRELYEGGLGAELASGLGALGCAITAGDLAGYGAEVTAPVRAGFHDVEVLTAPPPSQGYALPAMLAALTALPQVPDPLGPWAPALAHLWRLVAAERDRVLADPRHADVDVAALLTGGERRLEAARGAALGRSGDTVAVVAADDEGRAVSLIQSIYGAFGSGLVEPGTGIVLHNRGAAFSLDPGSPNVLAPGKRPAHTLMPVAVRRDGRVLGALGTMGGRAQPHILLQVLLRLLRGQDAAAAVAAPRVAGEGRLVLAESEAAAAAGAALRLAGFDVRDAGEGSEAVGHVQAVWDDGAGSDPRADGMAFDIGG